MSCAEGDVVRVYAGRIQVEVTSTDLSTMPRPRTHLMVNLANPALGIDSISLSPDSLLSTLKRLAAAENKQRQ